MGKQNTHRVNRTPYATLRLKRNRARQSPAPAGAHRSDRPGAGRQRRARPPPDTTLPAAAQTVLAKALAGTPTIRPRIQRQQTDDALARL